MFRNLKIFLRPPPGLSYPLPIIGVMTSLFETSDPTALVVDGIRSTSRLGNIARGAVALALLQQGRQVLLPLNDDGKYDLVIEEIGRFLKVQCKFGRLVNGTVAFVTCSNNQSSGRRDYRGQADYFGVYSPKLGTCYLVPTEDAPLRECRIRVDPTKNNQTQKIRWAADYLIGEVNGSSKPRTVKLVEPTRFERATSTVPR